MTNYPINIKAIIYYYINFGIGLCHLFSRVIYFNLYIEFTMVIINSSSIIINFNKHNFRNFNCKFVVINFTSINFSCKFEVMVVNIHFRLINKLNMDTPTINECSYEKYYYNKLYIPLKLYFYYKLLLYVYRIFTNFENFPKFLFINKNLNFLLNFFQKNPSFKHNLLFLWIFLRGMRVNQNFYKITTFKCCLTTMIMYLIIPYFIKNFYFLRLIYFLQNSSNF